MRRGKAFISWIYRRLHGLITDKYLFSKEFFLLWHRQKTKAGEKDFSASSAPSRKYLIAAYIGGLALAGYAARLAWVYMTYHALPLQGIILLSLRPVSF